MFEARGKQQRAVALLNEAWKLTEHAHYPVNRRTMDITVHYPLNSSAAGAEERDLDRGDGGFVLAAATHDDGRFIVLLRGRVCANAYYPAKAPDNRSDGPSDKYNIQTYMPRPTVCPLSCRKPIGSALSSTSYNHTVLT